MDELYRFSLARPAQRPEVATLSLTQSTALQETLAAIATVSPNEWPPLESKALDYLLGLPRQTPPDLDALMTLLDVFKSSLAATKKDDLDEELPNLQKPVRAYASLADTRKSMVDLFVAFLIFRSGGPDSMERAIKARNIIPELADWLRSGRPSLDEIAGWLRLIDLATTDPATIHSAEDVDAILNKTIMLPAKVFANFEKPVHAVGIADLLVVKQHILRYEPGEIARIENILKGETRKHAQRHFLSNERTTFSETERDVETTEELTSTDKTNLRTEIEKTLKEDLKITAGTELKLSGTGYEFGANLGVAYDRATSETQKFSSDVSKEVTQKAARRVTEKVRQSETIKVLETFDEMEEQSFDNDGDNVSGVYQWIDKVYLAQVFNYGKRVLFDLMVPEPAASLRLAAAGVKDDKDLGNEPGALEILPQDLTSVDENDPNYYGKFVKQYQVQGVQPPPPRYLTLSKAFEFKWSDDERRALAVDMKIEDGYNAVGAIASASWERNDDSGDNSFIDIMFGKHVLHLQGPGIDGWWPKPDANPASTKVRESLPAAEFTPDMRETRNVSVGIFGQDVRAGSVSIEITCEITDERYAQWQLEQYTKIAARWQALQDAYNAKKERKEQQNRGSAGLLGSAEASENRHTEMTELKRGCLAILDNRQKRGTDEIIKWPDVDVGPFADPKLPTAQSTGGLVRFFEQAFEWDKIGYVFYPYFWGNSDRWLDTLTTRSDDALFEKFLRAGYARVVVPVRRNFEDAVQFFMMTGRPWLGGGVPKIGDAMYLPITEEIKEQSGAAGDEFAVGEPWEIHLPTRLIKLRPDDTLPKWKPVKAKAQGPVQSWTWEEA